MNAEPKEPPINAAIVIRTCDFAECREKQQCMREPAAPNEPVAPLPSADEHEAFQRWAREQWGDRAMPVAWRYLRPGGHWFYTDYHDPEDPDCEFGEPLYATPAPKG